MDGWLRQFVLEGGGGGRLVWMSNIMAVQSPRVRWKRSQTGRAKVTDE